MFFWAFAGLGALTLAVWARHRLARKTYRPLSARQPQRRETEVPLGYEGLDLAEISRTNRRNESLERGQTNWMGKSGFFARADTDVLPLADDETYAARFHNAFQQDKEKTK